MAHTRQTKFSLPLLNSSAAAEFGLPLPADSMQGALPDSHASETELFQVPEVGAVCVFVFLLTRVPFAARLHEHHLLPGPILLTIPWQAFNAAARNSQSGL